MSEALALYHGSDVDIAWTHIVTGNPAAAAESLGAWATREPVGENQRRILKRQVSMLMWAGDNKAIAEVIAQEKRLRSLDAVPQSEEFLFRLAAIHVLVANAEFETAEASLLSILDGDVVEPLEIDPDLAAISGGLTLQNAEHRLATVDRAWCEVILARCQVELTINMSSAKDSAVSAFERLAERTVQMPEYLRWIVVNACEHIIRICELQDDHEEAEEWRSKLQKLESSRRRLSLNDTWHDSLFDFQAGAATEENAY